MSKTAKIFETLIEWAFISLIYNLFFIFTPIILIFITFNLDFNLDFEPVMVIFSFWMMGTIGSLIFLTFGYKAEKKWRETREETTTITVYSAVDGKDISVCYHKWRYFNTWCQECGGFMNDKSHGVIVHQCYHCGLMWDKENGDWTQEEINNIFFNKYYEGKV